MARVRLPQPVPPGGLIDLEIAFTAQLPKVFARTGYAGDYFLVGQWFPKIAVYEPAGVRGRAAGGWNATSSTPTRSSTPTSDATASTSRCRALRRRRHRRRAPRGPDNGDGTTTHIYEQADVHDFAWTASPRFVEITRRFAAAAEVTAQEYREAAARLGRSIAELRLERRRGPAAHAARAPAAGGAPPARGDAGDRGLRPGTAATRTRRSPSSIRPRGAMGAGGMEYPTFITAGTSGVQPLAAGSRPPAGGGRRPRVRPPVLPGDGRLERVRGGVARRGHHLVGDRVAGRRAARRRSIVARVAGLRVGDLDYQRLGNHRGRGLEMIRQPSWTYDTGYGFNAYGRPSLTLRTLEGLLGRRTMARVMRTYAERWRFGHPSSDDFYRVASEVAGRDLMPFFRQTIESPAVVDYAVGEITQDAAYTAVTVRRAGDLQIAGRRGVQVRRTSRRAPHLGRRGALDALHVRLRRAARVGRRGPRSQDRPRRVVAEQRARGRRRSARPGGDDVALAARRAAGPSWLAFWRPRRVSGVGAMRDGLARLWTRAAFAVVATWAIVTIVAVVAVAPAWAWWSAALGHTIDGARLLGSPNLATLVEVLARVAVRRPHHRRRGDRRRRARAAAEPVPRRRRDRRAGARTAGARARGRRRRPGARFAADGVWFYGPLLRVALIVWPHRRDRDWRQRGRRREPARRHAAPCWPSRPARCRRGRGAGGDDARRSGAHPRRARRTSAVPAAPCGARFASSAARRPACSCCGWRSARPGACRRWLLLAVRGWLSGETGRRSSPASPSSRRTPSPAPGCARRWSRARWC